MVSPVTFDVLRNEARLWTERALASGEYLGWLGTPKDQLHASDEARQLYEKMGFVATNEMRFAGGLEVRQP